VERFWPRRLDWHLLPRCLYQRPQIVQLGLTHHEIAARGNELDTYRQVVAAAERSAAEGAWSEFIEVVVDRFSGRVASVTAVANTVEPWIAPLLVMIHNRLALDAVADVVPCGPSRLELLRRIVDRYRADRVARFGGGWKGAVRARAARLTHAAGAWMAARGG
jgi:pyruvate/2-oxoglutarate dehydrogenase complex dihydrolipoamide dehydrogenase (E3) component